MRQRRTTSETRNTSRSLVYFCSVIINSHYVLQSLLPAKRDTQYNMRTRIHDGVLIDKITDLNDCDFIIPMLYKYRIKPVLLYFSFDSFLS